MTSFVMRMSVLEGVRLTQYRHRERTYPVKPVFLPYNIQVRQMVMYTSVTKPATVCMDAVTYAGISYGQFISGSNV